MTADVVKFPVPGDFFNMDSDRKVRAENKAYDNGLEPCTHCGRGIKKGSGWMTVIIDGGSNAVHPDMVTDAMRGDSGFMGAWVLGSTCIKGLPKAARKKWNGWN